MSMNVDLKGKVAVVTGGGGVLCSVMAKALAARGGLVAVLSRRIEKVQAVADAITEAGGRAIAISCDVLDRNALEKANDTIIEKIGPADILVNGAGGNSPEAVTSVEHHSIGLSGDVKSFFDLNMDGIDNTIRLNFTGTVLPSQVFAKSMVERGGGVIVNISSMSAFTPLTKIPAYSGAKAALSNFTQWLAVYMSTCNVRVNAIAPGFFLTEQNRPLLTNEDGSPTERGGKIISRTPMGRYGRPEELVGTLLWLVSDEASGFVTGAVIPVDGGFAAYSGV